MAQMAVPSIPIVKDFNVVKDIGTGQITGFVDTLADSFLLQATEERLSNSVVPAVSTATHARLQVVGLAEALPVIAAILAALIGMYQHRLCWLASQDSH